MRKLQLETDRLNIFIPDSAEAINVLNYFEFNKDHLRPTDPVLPKDFLTLPYWQKQLNLNIEQYNNDQSVRFFIELKSAPNIVLGCANLTQIARGPFQACYLGYSLSYDHQGKGLMHEALKEIIHYAFTKKHIHRIMANYLPENKRSANVLKSLNFRIDGSSPNYLFIQGQWREHILTSLTNTNWIPRPEDKQLFS